MTIRHARSIDDLFAALPDLAEEARGRAVEFEESRTIAPDFVKRLKAAGVYRLLVSREQGGLGGGLLDWLDMATTLAEADASTGWTSGHGAVCSALVANIAEPAFVEKVFADPMSSIAWSNLPRITAREEPDGLRIEGSWSFVTGCLAATHVGGIVFQLPTSSRGLHQTAHIWCCSGGIGRDSLSGPQLVGCRHGIVGGDRDGG
jgi:indole-3-acetate monooxygenase